MKEIMNKVHALYDKLNKSSAEMIVREEAVSNREEAAVVRDKQLGVRSQDISVKEKKYKNIDDALEEQARAKALKSEVLRQQAVLEEMRVDLDNAQVKADKILQNAQDFADETVATRQRLVVEVKRVEERKKKLKSEIMKELAGGE